MKLSALLGALPGSPWLLGAGAALCVLCVVLGVGAARWHYAPRLEAAELRAEGLGHLVREQARGVEAIKAERDLRLAQAAAALAKARGEARRHRTEAERILSLRPPAGADACTAACALIDAEVRP